MAVKESEKGVLASLDRRRKKKAGDPHPPDLKKSLESRSKYESLATDSQGAWWTALRFEDLYGKDIQASDMASLSRAKQELMKSETAEAQKARLLRYIQPAENKKGGRFAVLQSEIILNIFLKGDITDERLEYEERLMSAWCKGRMDAFMDEEAKLISAMALSAPELQKVTYLLNLAKSRSDVMKAVVGIGLRIYHPLQKEDTRSEILKALIETIDAARPSNAG